MKKLLLSFLLVVGMITVKAQNDHFEGGEGTPENPYKISMPNHLDNLRYYCGSENENVYFELVCDIDLTDYIASKYPVTGWDPIKLPGSDNWRQFFGKLNGNGYTVSGLWFNHPTRWYSGLFDHISGTIENLTVVTHPDGVTGYYWVGILAGEIKGQGRIINCHTHGTVFGFCNVGGLVGKVDKSSHFESTPSTIIIDKCSSTVEVYITGIAGGGLIGSAATQLGLSIFISNSFSKGLVYSQCSDNVPGVGGFIGATWNAGNPASILIQNCYTQSHVYTPDADKTGGFIGIHDYGTIMNCYSSGYVSGKSLNVGGFAGHFSYFAMIRNCFYDSDWNHKPIGDPISNPETGYIYGKSTSEMKQSTTFTGFAFPTTWKIRENCSYPYLSWETTIPPCVSRFSIESDNVLSEKNFDKQDVIRLYPNPATTTVTIETEIENPTTQVYDANGTMIISTTQKTVDLSSYPTGTYIFSINGEVKKVFKK